MNHSFKNAALPAILVFILVSMIAAALYAHGGGFRPPMRPTPPSPPPSGSPGGGVPGSTDGTPGTPSWGTPVTKGTGVNGPVTPGPRGPGTGNIPRTAGGMTKKARGATSTEIMWEHWWARNRYQFLDFPHLNEDAWKYPASPVALAGDSSIIATLKAESIDFLRPLISHSSPRLRRASMLGLARLGDYESLPAITDRLKDGNQTVRDAALLSLGILQKAEAHHTLLHVARGSKSAGKAIKQASIPDYFRGFAEVSLALGRAKGISTFLKTIAHDPRERPAVRAMALESIGLIGGEEASKFLIDFIQKSTAETDVLAAAVAALGKTESPVVVPTLRRCLSSKELHLRQSAALALGSIAPRGDADLVKELHRAFRHTNDLALKGFSLISMGRIGGSTAVKLLDQEVTSGKSSSCPWACLGLGFALQYVKDDQAAEHLLQQAANHANRSTRGAAAIALGLARYEKAVDDLITMMVNGDDPWYRGYCAMALGMIGDPRAGAPLRAALMGDKLPQVRVQAALSLALLRDRDAVDDMIEILMTSKNDTTQSFMSMSLSYMADLDIVDKIHNILSKESPDDLTLMHCITTTTKLLGGDPMPYLNRLAAGSNFACEYPLVAYLLEFTI